MLSGAYCKVIPQRADYPNGFTLAEVLATFVLVAIIIPVAMKGISLSTRIAAHSKQQIESASLAKTKLTEILASQEWQSVNSSGDFGPDWPEYRWAVEIQDRTEATLYQLDLHVFWDTQELEQSVTLTSLVYTESN